MNTNTFKQIGVAGDWHGNKAWSKVTLKNFALSNIQHILHVGDFGFWPGNGGKKYLYTVNKALTEYGQTLYITLGNHEDYVQIRSFRPHPTMVGFVYNPNYPNILVATRGARWAWEDTTFVSLGGANSIDFNYRTEWLTWWKDEQIGLGDIYKTVEGGYADIMVTHDCPAGVNIFGSNKNDFRWSPEQLRYANLSRDALRQAVDGVKPEMLFHGHHHNFLDVTSTLNDGVEDYVLRSVGLDMDGTTHNMGVLTLPDKTFVSLPVADEAATSFTPSEGWNL